MLKHLSGQRTTSGTELDSSCNPTKLRRSKMSALAASTTVAPSDMDRLDSRIQSLPQELQDNILDFTLLPAKAEPIIIQQYYRPPWQLQMDKRSRRTLIPLYYSQQIFEVSDLQRPPSASSWLRNLPPAALSAIRTVRMPFIIPYGWPILFGVIDTAYRLKAYANTLGDRLNRLAQLGMGKDWLYTDVDLDLGKGGAEKKKWMNVTEIKAMLEEIASSE